MNEDPQILYVAGPMSGRPQFNYPAFDAMAEVLRADGWLVQSPAEMDDPHIREAAMRSPDGNFREFDADLKRLGHEPETWGDFLSRDVKLIADTVDGIVLLEGWETSRGARLEAFVAMQVGKPVFFHHPEIGLIECDVELLMQRITENTIDQGDVSRYEQEQTRATA